MSDRYRQQSSGVAVLELAVVVVILAVIIAGGVYVMNHRSASSSSTNSQTSSSAATTTAQPGTTAGIAQLTQNDAQTEQQVDKNADSQTQNDALSANAAASSVGGAYNESTL